MSEGVFVEHHQKASLIEISPSAARRTGMQQPLMFL